MTVYKKWDGAVHLTRWLFNQADIWVTAQAEAVKVSEMTPGHALNTLLMLERMRDLQPSLDWDLQDTVLYKALKHRVTESLPAEAPKPGADPIPQSILEPRWFPRVAETRTAILDVLERVLLRGQIDGASSAPVRMTYVDREGHETERLIYPSRIERGPGRLGFTEQKYLVAVDVEKDDARTFRIDRIRKVEATC